MNIFGDKDKGSKHSHKREVHRGNYEDMMNDRKKKLPSIQKKIQELFENYDGGSVAIVMHRYDENGEVEGSDIAILGIDKPAGLIKLAKGLHAASEECVEMITKSGDPEMMMAAAVSMMEEIVNRHKEGK